MRAWDFPLPKETSRCALDQFTATAGTATTSPDTNPEHGNMHNRAEEDQRATDIRPAHPLTVRVRTR
ncbi:hypothetical protein ACQPYE_19975 [Actinosynnema sp. CA-299493]